jgi:hypothetical protein
MTVVNLCNLNGLPEKFLKELETCDSLFCHNESIEDLLKVSPINDLIISIDKFCRSNAIIGFHYTRAIPQEICESGLVCRTGSEIRNTFLTNFGDFFTERERIEIKKSWEKYFNPTQNEGRNNRLFFNFTTCALYNRGADRLLQNFGGEQVYMPIESLPDIAQKIKSLGKPLILKCKLSPLYLTTFIENPWGKIAVSTYHRLINPMAYQFDQDAYQRINVKSTDIEMIEYNDNWKNLL